MEERKGSLLDQSIRSSPASVQLCSGASSVASVRKFTPHLFVQGMRRRPLCRVPPGRAVQHREHSHRERRRHRLPQCHAKVAHAGRQRAGRARREDVVPNHRYPRAWWCVAGCGAWVLRAASAAAVHAVTRVRSDRRSRCRALPLCLCGGRARRPRRCGGCAGCLVAR